MKYDRAQLRATALEVKAAHENAAVDLHAQKVQRYRDEMKAWEAGHKDKSIKVLQDAIAKLRKGQPIDSLYHLDRAVVSPPTPPPSEADCCSVHTKKLDGLVELLDTLADDEVTSTSLASAGIRNVAELLRRPC